jgi:2-succinyl-6-hydroxy-2,4-cyclohexadiene-1-carboxylate synthase
MAKVDILGVSHDYEITPAQQSCEITVVFIHGWLLSRQYWTPIIDCVSSDFNCLSYDLRGFGNSGSGSYTFAKIKNPVGYEPERPVSSLTQDVERSQDSIERFANARCRVSSYSPAAYGRDLLLLLKQLKIRRPWLVGHSLGGTIALWAAAMSASNNCSTLLDLDDCPVIEGIVCLNSGGGIYVHEEFEKFRSVGQQILKFRPGWLTCIPGLDWVLSRSNVASAVDRRWGKQLLKDFTQLDGEAGKRALLDSTTSEEVLWLPNLVKSLQQPAYFIAGQNDPVMEPRFVKHLASFHALFGKEGDNLIELPNCGHLGMIEQPQQVSEFIRKTIPKYISPVSML